MNDSEIIERAFRRLFDGARYTQRRAGVTSDRDASGNAIARANTGCNAGYVWVRFASERAIKQVLSPYINNEAIGVEVEVAFDHEENEDVVTGIAASRALATSLHGESVFALGVPANVAAVQNPMVAGERLAPGAPVKDATAGGLYVRVLPFRQRNGDWWDGSATLQLSPTPTAGKRSLVLWGINPHTSTLVQARGADRDAWAILIPDDPTVDPLDLSDLAAVLRDNPDIDWKGVTDLLSVDSEVNPRKIVRVDHFGYAPPLANYSASAAPTATDDSDAGYSVGSVWFDGADIYACTDNTIGAAVWALRGGSVVENFIDLGDVPASYAGEGGKFVAVKAGEDGLEFLSGSTSIEVSDGATTVNPTTKLSLAGADFEVTDLGGGEAQVEIKGGGGGGVDVTDGVTSVLGATEIEFTSGATVTDAGGGVAQIAISGGGGGVLNVTKKLMQTRTVLHDETLSSNGSFDVSSIDQTYDWLEIVITARGTSAAANDVLYMTLNNDTTDANYRFGFGTGGSASSVSVAANRRISHIPASTALANSWITSRIFIPDYKSTARVKNAHGIAGWRDSSTLVYTQETALNWNDTSAINRIAFTTDNPGTDFLLAGSRLQIVGVKTEDVVVDVTLT